VVEAVAAMERARGSGSVRVKAMDLG
jgi:hypothetical protein